MSRRRRVCLIGQPLKRKHSAVMHNAAFRHYGVPAHYELQEIAAEGLAPFFAEARGPQWLGFQVTAPHKQASLSYVDNVLSSARAIGAINTGVRLADGTLEGFNTDADGFTTALSDDLGVGIEGAEFVVAGAGGAARAVVWGLLTHGAGRVVVGNRDPGRALELADRFGELGTVSGVDLSGVEFARALSTADVAINATSVGMTTPGVPFDVSRLRDGAGVFDLVYVPPVTPLIAAARRQGLAACNGVDMLVRQAEIAFERWTGIPGAAKVMREALEMFDDGEAGGP